MNAIRIRTRDANVATVDLDARLGPLGRITGPGVLSNPLSLRGHWRSQWRSYPNSMLLFLAAHQHPSYVDAQIEEALLRRSRVIGAYRPQPMVRDKNAAISCSHSGADTA